MKLAFVLYWYMLYEEHYKFAKQFGASHLVVHLVNYFGNGKNNIENSNQPIDEQDSLGSVGGEKIWSLEELLTIKKKINSQGLEWEANENFDTSIWRDILLDEPKEEEQIEIVNFRII